MEKDVKRLGNYYGFEGRSYAGNVYDSKGLAPTLGTMQGGHRQPMIVDCVAMRGRNPENPSDRTPGIETEQRLEVRPDGCVGTIATVQKDNMVLEKVIIDDTYQNRNERIYENYAPTLRAGREGLKVVNVRQATKEGFISCEVGGG